MKVIFLDCDGVMNSGRHGCRCGGPFDPEAVQALNHIVRMTGASIVISSSWRSFYTLTKLRQIFRQNGVKYPIMSLTPDDAGPGWLTGPNGHTRARRRGRMESKSAVRCHQIQQWLDSTTHTVGCYIVIDDEDVPQHVDRLIRTNPETGITMQDAVRAVSILESIQ